MPCCEKRGKCNPRLAAATSSQGTCAPAALSSPDRTKCSTAGIAPPGTKVCSACQARQWKTSVTNSQHWRGSVTSYKHPHRVRHTVVWFSSAGSKNVVLNCCCKIIMLTFSTIQILPGRDRLHWQDFCQVVLVWGVSNLFCKSIRKTETYLKNTTIK